MTKKIGFVLAVGALLATPAIAGSGGALSLVPADVTAVGFVRVADLRSNPFQLRVFEETDKLTSDGDAARFLAEAGLDLHNDVDAVVACTTGSREARGRTLVAFEGRFDPARVASALTQRGAVGVSIAGGDYFRLKESSGERGPGAVAVLGPNLILAGNETAVAAALGARLSGGGGFSTGSGLGREYHRVDPAATAWVLVDVQGSRVYAERSGASSSGVMGALKSVSVAAFQARVEGDALAIKATGLSNDEETRELIEDALRGVTAAWRMAAQEKNPELVSVIRQFKITRDDEGVTISGTLPGDLIRSFTAAKRDRATR
jgi:hypothetical protein